MKVVGINSSPRKESNTALLIGYVFEELQQEGIETELIRIGGRRISGCRACYKCFQNADRHCSIKTDVVNGCIDKMAEADGIVLGSPTYFSNVNAEMKALIDRSGLVSTANGGMYKHKVGAAVTAVRRAGALPTYDAMNHFFLYNQMFVAGSTYWNLGIGMNPGDVAKDEEGVRTMRNLGRNIAWLLEKIGG
jgi:multimeric flavodoxin WrbA